MPNSKTVLPSHTDMAAVYGLLDIKSRREVRDICLIDYEIPERSFYHYLRTNRMKNALRVCISKAINIVLVSNTDYTWEYKK